MVPFGFTSNNPPTLIFNANSHTNNNQRNIYYNNYYNNGNNGNNNNSSNQSNNHPHNNNGSSMYLPTSRISTSRTNPPIPLLGDWIPKITDSFIMSRLYAGVDGRADTWRPAQDISRLLTMSKFIELRERIERHRETTDFPSNTKPPLLRYAFIAVMKLCQRNPPLLQVTDLPVNAFNHPMMPPSDRCTNDLSHLTTDTIQTPCVGFHNTKWALTEAGKRWVEENCKISSNKRKAAASTEAKEVKAKQPRIEIVAPSYDRNLMEAFSPASGSMSTNSISPSPILLKPLELNCPVLQDQQRQQQQFQQQLPPLITTTLLSTIQAMQERLGTLEGLYSTLNQRHQVLQDEHNILKKEHQELQDKVSTAKQMTKLIDASP